MGAALSVRDSSPDKRGAGARRGMAVLALLLCLGGSVAHAEGGAPDALFGLPLVAREGGWARYVNTSADGPSRFVVKVGGPGRHEGKRGRWMFLEVDVPATGRIRFDFLVEGERFSAKSVLLLRLRIPGRPPSDTVAPFNQPGAERQPHLLRQSTETVAGKKLAVTEYSYPMGITAQWSPGVPGLGLVRVSGTQSFQLETFGVGGDPWKGADAP
ncbi:hypothetical protein D7V93_42765 [Corallococcus llansteffanensis]|uniref:Uncharacterized protein n=2 Tax=Corallococcus llansteffanensis TaxID=2316731 RepID=A0A3A8NBH6_9BACT|nr:hypothetical protein D7V93_42765 [Corallococcus llansteffanensis]